METCLGVLRFGCGASFIAAAQQEWLSGLPPSTAPEDMQSLAYLFNYMSSASLFKKWISKFGMLLILYFLFFIKYFYYNKAKVETEKVPPLLTFTPSPPSKQKRASFV